MREHRLRRDIGGHPSLGDGSFPGFQPTETRQEYIPPADLFHGTEAADRPDGRRGGRSLGRGCPGRDRSTRSATVDGDRLTNAIGVQAAWTCTPSSFSVIGIAYIASRITSPRRRVPSWICSIVAFEKLSLMALKPSDSPG
jgi:hypothetical protein